jgi:DNA-binding NarL/FixJ family response regulator
MIHLILVDDQPLIRRGLKAVLNLEADLQIVGEADQGQAAIALLESLSPDNLPDLVLMDVRMPIMDGVAAAEAIGQRFPSIKVLMLTTFDDHDYVVQALRAGAVGYLLKDTPTEELTQAIRLVAKGYTQIAPGLAQRLVSSPPPPTPARPEGWHHLTPREQEILHLIAQGASNREIAQTLYIAEKTVRNHVTQILGQLGLRDRTQAAILMHTHFPDLKLATTDLPPNN